MLVEVFLNGLSCIFSGFFFCVRSDCSLTEALYLYFTSNIDLSRTRFDNSYCP